MTDQEYIQMRLAEGDDGSTLPPAVEMLWQLLRWLRATWLAQRRTRLPGSG